MAGEKMPESTQVAYFLAIQKKIALGEMGEGKNGLLTTHVDDVIKDVFPRFPNFLCTQEEFEHACQLTPYELVTTLVNSGYLNYDRHGINSYRTKPPDRFIEDEKRLIERNKGKYGKVPQNLLCPRSSH